MNEKQSQKITNYVLSKRRKSDFNFNQETDEYLYYVGHRELLSIPKDYNELLIKTDFNNGNGGIEHLFNKELTHFELPRITKIGNKDVYRFTHKSVNYYYERKLIQIYIDGYLDDDYHEGENLEFLQDEHHRLYIKLKYHDNDLIAIISPIKIKED